MYEKSQTLINLGNDEGMEVKSKNMAWIPSSSVLVVDRGGSVKFNRRWNQLSRMQRSFAYALLLIAFTGILLFILKDKRKISELETPVVNISLVMDQTGDHVPISLQAQQNSDVRLSNDILIFTGPTNDRQRAVVKSFQHAWNGYKQYAWGSDNLKPISKTKFNWFHLGLTIVDSLDTAFIMGLSEEFEEGKQWIADNLVFTRDKDVNLFEVTIRVLGSLLTNYHFTKDGMFLKKAEDLGDRLMSAFNTPSGIPYSDVNLGTKTAHSPTWSLSSSTAEVTTIQLEFRELSRLTNNDVFELAAAGVSEKIHQEPKKDGLVPIFITPNSGHFVTHAAITLGARGDSYYEYLLKQWIQTGKTLNYLLEDYLEAMNGVRDLLAKRSSPNKLLFIGELTLGSEGFNPKMDHLTCFLPGTLALGHANGLPDWHMKMAEELLYTCYLTYAAHPTFLAPEITHFNLASTTDDMYTKPADAHSLLRPEFVESLWVMYQLTGNTTYQDWGWTVYKSFEKYAKVPSGYTSLANVRVKDPPSRDMMESFFLAETLKYLYLLFSEDRYIIDLRKYVINTEAHPLPIHDY